MAQKKRGSTLGKDLARFEKIVGGNPTKMYLGQSPSTPDPVKVKAMNRRAKRIAEKLDVELRVYMEAYLLHKTHKAAWMSLHPDGNPANAGHQGWLVMEKIREVLPEKEIHAMLGMSAEAVVSAIGRGLVSRAKKSFILPKSGEIRETESYDDTANQLAAAGLAAKMLKMIPDDKPGTDSVVVNIVSYLGPDAKPWPDGGRVDADGVMRNTVGPGSPAARAAHPSTRSVTVDLGGPQNRDD